MEKLLVLSGGALLIGFIVWWFFSKRDNQSTEATMSDDKQRAEVTVNGGYVPNTVVLKQGVPLSVEHVHATTILVLTSLTCVDFNSKFFIHR